MKYAPNCQTLLAMQVVQQYRTAKMKRAFTLVELLVVLVIIGILVALLLPAINAAVVRAQEAAVSSEINGLSTALVSFNTVHGCYPPSRILLMEDGDYTPANIKAKMGTVSNVAAAIALTPRSMTYIRKIWPRVQVSATSPQTGLFLDFNGNGVLDPPIIINGSECLPFFLGGQPQRGPTGKWSLTGFSKNPANPLVGLTLAPSRTRSDYDFDNGRFVDLDNNGYPEYVDSFGGIANPGVFAYFSSYEGQGYDCDDINLTEPDDSGTYPATNAAFQTSNDPTASNVTNTIGYASSPSPNPLVNGNPLSTNSLAYWKPQSFQLFTSGRDRQFGVGGQYDPNANETLPWTPSMISANTALTGQTLDLGIRGRERDNLSNLTRGRLDP